MEQDEVIRLLKLEKHPKEGGWFRETYRSKECIALNYLPQRYTGDRAYSTLIYYLIAADRFSGFHRVQSDEIFHFYLGDAAHLVTITPHGELQETVLGGDIAAGQTLQSLVERGHWQAVYLKPGGKWALLGATVSPGFEYVDFEDAQRQPLIAEFPQHKEIIAKLTDES